MSFIYAAIICLIWYFLQICKHHGYLESYLLATRIKSALTMMLYGKMSSLTSYIIKSSQMGKITNLLASDLGVIELRISYMLNSFSFPIYAIGNTVLLITRLGWPGILGITFMIIFLPLTNCVSKRNSEIVKKINEFKDERI